MDKELWKNPKEFKELDMSQAPLWFWNDKLENEELVRQMKLMSEVGVKCAIPHGRGNQGDGYIGGYLDDDWFDKINTVLEYKKKNDEPCWIYDEMDWPAGTCNKTLTKIEEYRERYLCFKKYHVSVGEEFRYQILDLYGKSKSAVASKEDIKDWALNAFIFNAKTMKQYDVTDYLTYSKFGLTLELTAKEELIIYTVDIAIDSYENGGDQEINYLDKNATEAFLKSTYDKYYERFKEYFGNTLKAVFNDETRMSNAFAWSNDFPKEFIKAKGYDIMPRLADLVIEGEEAGRTRVDYFDVLAMLYQKNYLGTIKEWCEKHNIELFAHLLGEETLASQVRYSGDMMRQFKNMDIPGLDHLGKGIGSLNAKFAVSAARSYGKENMSVEVFAGCGWDMTFEEYIRIISWLYQQGLQIIINHGFFYSTRDTRKDDWPPSQFFQWQGFDRMSEGNDMVRRLYHAFTGGIPEVGILMYNPTESFWFNYLADDRFTHGYTRGALIKNDRAATIDKELQLLMNELICNNMDFDMLHKEAVENYRVENNTIVNTLNNEQYKILILPMCEVLPVEAARLMKEFAYNGGTVIAVDCVPQYSMSKETDKEVRTIVEQLVKDKRLVMLELDNKAKLIEVVDSIVDKPFEIIEGIKTALNNHPSYDAFLVDPYTHENEDLDGVLYTRYIKDNKRNVYFVNYTNNEQEVKLKVNGSVPVIWDTFTGEIYTPKIIEKADNYSVILLKLPCNYGVIMEMDI